MIDLKKIGEWFTKKNLWEASFNQLTEAQIMELGMQFLSSPGFKCPPYGWKKPFITEAGELIIPFDAHPKYRWWDPDGQSVAMTLKELNASPEVMKRYLDLAREVPY